MKVIAIIEVPESGKGKWYIDGEIRYTENKSLMKKFDVETIPLKPLPETKDVGYPIDDYAVGFGDGWDACIKELTK